MGFHDLESFNKTLLANAKRQRIKQIVLDEKFWVNCLMIVGIMKPLIRFLQLYDTNEKPSLGYIYGGIYRARMGNMNTFKNNKKNVQALH